MGQYHPQRHNGGGNYHGGYRNPPAINKVNSPYNFVKLGTSVFFPDWADKVSHDVPFKDSFSGTIDIKITAKTPIYIRNGGAHPDQNRNNDQEYKDFFKTTKAGEYAIPGSSLKGLIRNVLQVISFGKMNQVDNHRYSIRDLTNKQDYINKITKQESNAYAPKAKAGWIKKNEKGDWILSSCDFYRVEHSILEKGLGIRDLGRKQSAKDKYRRYGDSRTIYYQVDPPCVHKHSRVSLYYSKVTKVSRSYSPETPLKGSIVFTGQPLNYVPGKSGKHMEFIFPHKVNPAIQLPIQLVKDFTFIHSTPSGDPNDELKYWKSVMAENRAMPVFFLEEGGKIKSLGLALMYRLAYDHTIHEVISHSSSSHFESKPDLAEVLFGKVDENEKNHSLKGRVSFGTCLASQIPSHARNAVRTVLGSPKPTFYPNYIEQATPRPGELASPESNYVTMMSAQSKVRGWKRYPVRPSSMIKPLQAPTSNVEVQFIPLPEGSVFEGTVRFHNLTRFELESLVWSLTWGENRNLSHSIGMAKPYGFGSVQIEISAIKTDKGLLDHKDPSFYAQLISTLDAWCKKNYSNQTWLNTTQMKNILAMADPQVATQKWNGKLGYPNLNDKDFANIKKAKKVLESYV